MNLRHLCLGRAIRLPKGLRELTCLETLHCLVLATGRSSKKGYMKLEDLSELNNLKGSLCVEGLRKRCGRS